jgi:hypothetical protein
LTPLKYSKIYFSKKRKTYFKKIKERKKAKKFAIMGQIQKKLKEMC